MSCEWVIQCFKNYFYLEYIAWTDKAMNDYSRVLWAVAMPIIIFSNKLVRYLKIFLR